VEDEEDRLLFLSSNLLLNIGLMFFQQNWLQLDVSWLVDTVNVLWRVNVSDE
jgi:hypothetical protein